MHDELFNDFKEESIDLMEKVKRALASWNETADKVDAINSIYRWVHTIKGGCGIFDFKETAAVAHELETFLGSLKKNVDKITKSDLERVESSILEIENSFNGQALGKIEILEPQTGFKTQYFSEWAAASEEIIKDLLNDGFLFFELLLPTEIYPKLIQKLQEHNIVSLESQEKGAATASLFSVNVKDDDALKQKAQNLIERFDGQWCTEEAQAEAEVSASKPAASSSPERTAAPAEEVLRVPLATVNSILDHIWELFLVRNQMAHLFKENKHIFKEHHGFIQQFESLDNVIERNIHALDSKTMSLRLNPIKKIFDRMDKVVKEYCSQSDKKIKLITQGEGIDLDKKVLDSLNEPLIHLIRNSIDHGIESPAERQKLGKSPEGHVELSAQLQGNEVSILISDDGKGIDANKILASARSKQMDVSNLKTEQEILELIFAPGFSTAEKVTDVSGRGVGMDAVRSSINELGGHVSLETEVGKGTKFRINLPLTMSVSKCLIVTIHGIDYAIPTKSVVFVEKVGIHSLKFNGKDQFYEFNGNLIPCYTMGDMLPDFRAEPDLPITHTHICVTNINGQQMAFRVDEVLQTLNVVLKPLPKAIGKHPSVAGVSILPGGNPIFVLNIHECLIGKHKTKKGDCHVQRAA